MARFNSLLGRNKFPVPLRRELRRKPLYLALDCKPIVALEGPDRPGRSRAVPEIASVIPECAQDRPLPRREGRQLLIRDHELEAGAHRWVALRRVVVAVALGCRLDGVPRNRVRGHDDPTQFRRCAFSLFSTNSE